MVSYNVQYQKKLIIQSWQNLVNDRQTDRQIDNSYFIGSCPTNVKHPTYKHSNKEKSKFKYVLSTFSISSVR